MAKKTNPQSPGVGRTRSEPDGGARDPDQKKEPIGRTSLGRGQAFDSRRAKKKKDSARDKYGRPK